MSIPTARLIRRVLTFVGLAIIIFLLLLVGVNAATPLAEWQRWVQTYGVFGIVALVLIRGVMAAIEWYEARRSKPTSFEQYTTSPPLDDAARNQLLLRLRATYDDWIKKSLGEAVELTLSLTTAPELAQLRLATLLPIIQPRTPTEVDWTLSAFLQSHQQLLIVGDGGMGKTFTLVKLARDLTVHGENNAAAPIPYVLNLTKWIPGQDIAPWAAAQIAEYHGTGYEDVTNLIANAQAALLLDGLDELEPAVRPACIAAINAYRTLQRGTMPQPLIVVCNENVYSSLSQTSSLQLGGAIKVLPLDPSAVIRELRKEARLRGAAQALRDDPELHDFVTTPLFCGMFVLAFADITASKLRGMNKHSRRALLFRTYLKSLLRRQRLPKRFGEERALVRLRALARALQQTHSSDFALDHLQPRDWLTPSGVRVWCIGVLALQVTYLIGVSALLASGLPRTTMTFTVLLLIIRLYFVRGPMSRIEHYCRISYNNSAHKQYRLPDAISAVIISALSTPFFVQHFTIFYGFIAAIIFALCIFSFMQAHHAINIEPRFQSEYPGESIKLSVRWNLIYCLIFTAGMGIFIVYLTIFAIAFGRISNNSDSIASFMTSFDNSLQKTAFVSLFSGLTIGIVISPSIYLSGLLKHYLLRIFLIWNGTLPMRVIPAYNALRASGLLEAKAGIYYFRHNLIRDYIAALSDEEIKAIVSEV